MDVTTQVFVNYSSICNFFDPDIESHKKAFSPCTWFVTSINGFYVEFIIKAMLSEKKKILPPRQESLGNRRYAYASEFGHKYQNIWKKS